MWQASHGRACKHASACGPSVAICGQGLLRELNPGPLAPEARIMPLDQAASGGCLAALHIEESKQGSRVVASLGPPLVLGSLNSGAAGSWAR